MTTSEATIEGLRLLGLPDCERLVDREPDQVDEPNPAGDAVQQAREEAQVRAPAQLIRGRIHHATVLCVIAAVQFIWIAALIYGLRLLLA
jgi:hypothetical protein